MKPYRKQTVNAEYGDLNPPDGYYLAFAETGTEKVYRSTIFVDVPVWHLIWAPYTDTPKTDPLKCARCGLPLSTAGYCPRCAYTA